MAVYGDASDILERNSSILDELLTNPYSDPQSHFCIRKHSISNIKAENGKKG